MMKSFLLHGRTLPLWLTGLFASFALSTNLSAQAPSPRYSQTVADSISITSIDVGAIRNRKDLEMVPWEIISAFGIQELGVDPLLIESVDISASMPSPNGPEFGGVIRTTKPVDIADLSSKLFGEVASSSKIKGMRSRNANDAPIKIAQTEEQVILFGSEGTLRRMLGKPSKGSKAIDLLNDSKYPMRSVTNFANIKPIIAGGLADMESQIPPSLYQDIEVVIEELEYVVSSNDMAGLSAQIELKLVAKDGESAARLATALGNLRTNGMEFAELSLRNAIRQEQEMSPELKQACLQYMERAKEFLGKADLWTVNGDEIAINGAYSYSIPTIGVLTFLLLPAVQAAREAARRMQSSNNVKQLLLAMLNHESAYRQFPLRATVDKNGGKLLSWRVALLPYLEENALYNEFHQDEPWDSPHNIQLVDRMPAIFRHPSSLAEKGHTVYLAPYRDDTIWNSKKPKMNTITDGTSNTIAIVEVQDEYAVPWTKPEDLDLNDLENFSLLRAPTAQAGFFDGSVRTISNAIDSETLEALVTSQGGEVVNVP